MCVCVNILYVSTDSSEIWDLNFVFVRKSAFVPPCFSLTGIDLIKNLPQIFTLFQLGSGTVQELLLTSKL